MVNGPKVESEIEAEVSYPKPWLVWIHNDDYTPMEFVVDVLRRFFGKNVVEAQQLMLKVHHDGKAIAGSYTKDIAETKVIQVTQIAEKEGYPLLLTFEIDGG